MLRSVIVWLFLCSICYADTESYKAEVAARKERAKALAMEKGLARHKRVLAKKNSAYTYQYFHAYTGYRNRRYY